MVLVEPHIQQQLIYSLSNVHEYRMNIYRIIWNSFFTFTMIFIVGLILYFRYKGKPTEEELYRKMMREQEYVLSQIRAYKGQLQHSSIITGLPIVGQE